MKPPQICDSAIVVLEEPKKPSPEYENRSNGGILATSPGDNASSEGSCRSSASASSETPEYRVTCAVCGKDPPSICCLDDMTEMSSGVISPSLTTESSSLVNTSGDGPELLCNDEDDDFRVQDENDDDGGMSMCSLPSATAENRGGLLFKLRELDDQLNDLLVEGGGCEGDDVDFLSEDEEAEQVGREIFTKKGTGTAEKAPPEVADSLEQGGDTSFTNLRFTYLLVTLVIMLADGLQGTHLYVLYEGYGFSVASLYCLGFVTGGFMSPVTGPMVDKIGRKKAAILYCVLEILINTLDQYPNLLALIASRMIGGFTTNLLSSVFESWLDTEYRKRGYPKARYEIVMRDAVIVSNLAAIFSGYMAHTLAERRGAVGPFEGAVACTAIALVVVMFLWTENYGTWDGSHDDTSKKDMVGFLKEAVSTFRRDHKIFRVGIIQGLSSGSIQIFVFLWAPALRQFAMNAPKGSWGLDTEGAPAYGLVFGAYMFAGVMGGLVAPAIRQFISSMLPTATTTKKTHDSHTGEVPGSRPYQPTAVEFLAAACYFCSAVLLFIPALIDGGSKYAFTTSLLAFLAFEVLIGIFLPCEGVIRSLHFPATARASIMTLPRIIVNLAVSLGVVSTNFIGMETAFSAVGCLMFGCAVLQLTLVDDEVWSSMFQQLLQWNKDTCQAASLQKSNVMRSMSQQPLLRRISAASDTSEATAFSSRSIIVYEKPKGE